MDQEKFDKIAHISMALRNFERADIWIAQIKDDSIYSKFDDLLTELKLKQGELITQTDFETLRALKMAQYIR